MKLLIYGMVLLAIVADDCHVPAGGKKVVCVSPQKVTGKLSTHVVYHIGSTELPGFMTSCELLGMHNLKEQPNRCIFGFHYQEDLDHEHLHKIAMVWDSHDDHPTIRCWTDSPNGSLVTWTIWEAVGPTTCLSEIK